MFRKMNDQGSKAIIMIIIAFVFGLAIWLFFWPLVECIYAYSWDPLFESTTKVSLFVIGGVTFVGSVGFLGKIIL